MGVRNFRYGESDETNTGETAKGEGGTFLVYQTTQATAVGTVVGGASVGSVKGPQETSMCIAAYANSAVNSTGANGTTYDVTFYGGSTSTEAPQLAAINGAVNQADDDGIDIGELTGYPYTSDPQASATEVNGASQVPIIVCINNSVVS
jgi:hypothetical protein